MPSINEGLVEWPGRAGQVRVGHYLQGMQKSKDDVWEVLEMKTPEQIQYGRTLWWRVANRATGVVASIAPKVVTAKVTFMVTPEQFEVSSRTKLPPHRPKQWPVDTEEVLELMEKLGAREIAVLDKATGEVTCPDYDGTFDSIRPGGYLYGVEELEHLRICHGLDTSGLEVLRGDERVLAIARAHGQLHGPDASRIPHAGFPHRHVPEDHRIL